jgi:hypothetical protein
MKANTSEIISVVLIGDKVSPVLYFICVRGSKSILIDIFYSRGYRIPSTVCCEIPEIAGSSPLIDPNAIGSIPVGECGSLTIDQGILWISREDESSPYRLYGDSEFSRSEHRCIAWDISE